MPGDRCAVCGITKTTDPNISFHRIPKDPIMRAKWTDALHLQKENLGSSSRVCSRHFQKGDPRNSPSLFLWKRIKQDSRAQRAKNREARRLFTITPERVTTCSSAAIVSDINTTPSTSTPLPQILIAQVGDQLDTNYTVYELLGPSGLQRMKEC